MNFSNDSTGWKAMEFGRVLFICTRSKPRWLREPISSRYEAWRSNTSPPRSRFTWTRNSSSDMKATASGSRSRLRKSSRSRRFGTVNQSVRALAVGPSNSMRAPHVSRRGVSSPFASGQTNSSPASVTPDGRR